MARTDVIKVRLTLEERQFKFTHWAMTDVLRALGINPHKPVLYLGGTAFFWDIIGWPLRTA